MSVKSVKNGFSRVHYHILSKREDGPFSSFYENDPWEDFGGAIFAGLSSMKKLILFFVFVTALPLSFHASASGQNSDLQRWERQARNITITRDDWGIAHIDGNTDADAVFGAIYAQAEDDFNRIETNYLNSMGRLAEAEGESAVWRDLRMKLFIRSCYIEIAVQGEPLVVEDADERLGGRSKFLSGETSPGKT